jgi:hypothetical protein
MPTVQQLVWIPVVSLTACGLLVFWRCLAVALDTWEDRRQKKARAAYELERVKKFDARLDVKDGPWQVDMLQALPGVVHVIPFDFAAARRAQERLKAEEAFYETHWGEEGTRH